MYLIFHRRFLFERKGKPVLVKLLGRIFFFFPSSLGKMDFSEAMGEELRSLCCRNLSWQRRSTREWRGISIFPNPHPHLRIEGRRKSEIFLLKSKKKFNSSSWLLFFFLSLSGKEGGHLKDRRSRWEEIYGERIVSIDYIQKKGQQEIRGNRRDHSFSDWISCVSIAEAIRSEERGSN